MPEHISTNGYNGNVNVNVSEWLYGVEARKIGKMFDSNTQKYDIFGFILKSSGYSINLYPNLRTPSQFAQLVIERSGTKLRGSSAILTTTTHVDEDITFKLGIANDNIGNIYDIERNIANILSTKDIGVKFIDLPINNSGTSNIKDIFLAMKALAIEDDIAFLEEYSNTILATHVIKGMIINEDVYYLLINRENNNVETFFSVPRGNSVERAFKYVLGINNVTAVFAYSSYHFATGSPLVLRSIMRDYLNGNALTTASDSVRGSWEISSPEFDEDEDDEDNWVTVDPDEEDEEVDNEL